MLPLRVFDALRVAVSFVIGIPTDFIYAVALLDHLRRIQRLSLTDVHSRGCVAIGKA